MLPTLKGLGTHFNVSCSEIPFPMLNLALTGMQNIHRAVRLNDNLDGTLTDLGTYADLTYRDGRKSGSFAKPALIVSKKLISLSESPIVESSPSRVFYPKPTVPQRGGPSRRSAVRKAVSEEVEYSAASESEAVPDGSPDPKSRRLRTSTGTNKHLDLANPDRPYDMWPSKYRRSHSGL